MIVIAILLVLMTCWSFWGWTVGDSRNIRWIRHWCGGTFVILVAVLSAGGGFMAARVQERAEARGRAFEALQTVADRLEAGETRRVITALRGLDHRGDPDEDAFDLLDELPDLTAKLQPQQASELADSAPPSTVRR